MNKEELVDAIASETKETKAAVLRVLDSFAHLTGKSLKKGDRVMIRGFGSFYMHKRAARNGYNPLIGKTLKIPAKRVAKFRAGDELAAMVE